MGIGELCLIAVGLSMDAFAVSVCKGLTMEKATLRKALTVGMYFGLFQALMPMIGYLAASRFAANIISYDHWVAFVLLCILGARMIKGSFEGDDEEENREEASLAPTEMLPLALATSIDAAAVGISFAFLRVSIVPAASFIGVTTLMLSAVGVKTGNMFGLRFKAKAECLGGVILILIGAKILAEHVGLLGI